jgi:predicted porin
MIAYETPDFACFKVYAQYGMGNAVEDYGSEENESSSDRFYAIGAT